MAELSVQSVDDYTQGRIDGREPETARLLAAALGAARRYCGWHVTPLRTAEQITLDGPGTDLLVLPTLRLTAITELTEDGVDVDVDGLNWSTRGLVRKNNCGWWSGKFGAIEVKMTHGFDDAPDWQAVVLSLIDRWSEMSTGGLPNVVGPVQWPTRESVVGAFTSTERYVLDMYALESAP